MYQSVPFYRSGWNGNFRYKYLENHTVYFVENYMVLKLKYCIIRFYIFYFFKIINYHFNSEYLTFKLVVGPPQGFWGSGEKGYLFSGSWGALLIILGELGSRQILLGI